MSALALAQEAERNGCENVLIKVPDGDLIGLQQFTAQYCHPSTLEDPSGLHG